MRLLALTVSFIAISHSALADTLVLDGTDAGLDEGMITNIIIALADEGFSDPASAQFHSLSVATGVNDVQSVCGFVNMKRQNGSYGGFMPMVYTIHSGNVTVVLPPEEDQIGAAVGNLALSFSECDDALGIEIE